MINIFNHDFDSFFSRNKVRPSPASESRHVNLMPTVQFSVKYTTMV